MWLYYITRSSFITSIVLTIWLIGNCFFNIPPDFNEYKGDVMHKTLVKTDTARYNGHDHYTYHYDFCYMTKSGHTVNVKDYEYEPNDSNYPAFINKNEFYVTNGWNITIFILLCVYGYFGTLITLMCDGVNNVDQMIEGRTNKIKVRDMRINHYKRTAGILGFTSQQSKEDFLNAVEQYRHNPRYESDIKNGYRIYVPDLTNIDEGVEECLQKIRNERKQEETKIADGTTT